MQLISYRCPACARLVSVPEHSSSRPLRAAGVTQQRACWSRCTGACKCAGGVEVWRLGLCCGRSHGKLTNRGRNIRARMLALVIHKLMGWFLVVTVKELWQTGRSLCCTYRYSVVPYLPWGRKWRFSVNVYMNLHIKPFKNLVKVSICAIPISDVRCAQLILNHPREVLHPPMRKLMSASEVFLLKLSVPLFTQQLFVPPVASVGLISFLAA